MKEVPTDKQENYLTRIGHSADQLKELLEGLAVLVDKKKNRAEKMEYVDFDERLDLVMEDYRETLHYLNLSLLTMPK